MNDFLVRLLDTFCNEPPVWPEGIWVGKVSWIPLDRPEVYARLVSLRNEAVDGALISIWNVMKWARDVLRSHQTSAVSCLRGSLRAAHDGREQTQTLISMMANSARRQMVVP